MLDQHLPDTERTRHEDTEGGGEVGTEVLLEVGGEGGQHLQGGLQAEDGARPQVVSEVLHYLCLTEHHLTADNLNYCSSTNQSIVTPYLSQRAELLQFPLKLIEISAEVEFPPVGESF